MIKFIIKSRKLKKHFFKSYSSLIHKYWEYETRQSKRVRIVEIDYSDYEGVIKNNIERMFNIYITRPLNNYSAKPVIKIDKKIGKAGFTGIKNGTRRTE